MTINGKKAVSGTEFLTFLDVKQKEDNKLKPLKKLLDKKYEEFVEQGYRWEFIDSRDHSDRDGHT